MKASPLTILISVAGIILAAGGLYFSALLPYMKAQSYISAERRLGSVQTVDDYKANYDQMFNLYSPVGDEEVTKFLANNVLNIVSQEQPEDVARELVAYIEPHLFKDEVRHLLLLGQMYQTLWEKFDQEGDYLKAVEYFEKAHQIGPNLPPPLYKLLSLYAAHNDQENFKRIGSLILSKWPHDEAVSSLFK